MTYTSSGDVRGRLFLPVEDECCMDHVFASRSRTDLFGRSLTTGFNLPPPAVALQPSSSKPRSIIMLWQLGDMHVFKISLPGTWRRGFDLSLDGVWAAVKAAV
eukprot:3937429-Rhodomonas_salina.6